MWSDSLSLEWDLRIICNFIKIEAILVPTRLGIFGEENVCDSFNQEVMISCQVEPHAPPSYR